VIAVSETVVLYIRENYPKTAPERIRLIHRGVDREAFPFGYLPAQGWQTAWYDANPKLSDARVLTLAGRLTRLKGHQDFIRLIHALRSRGLEVQGLLVGGVDPRRQRYAAQLCDLVSQLGLEESVSFTGHRDDIKEIYACSDLVFSLSAKPESFGRTVVEALSMGIPVIGYDHGGVGEVLARLFPEGRVPLNDPERLIQKTVEFLGSPPVVPVSTDFTLQAMLDKTLALYQELSGRN
jgi:glycosyltransferase involved in cell wall biosynthesis